MKFSSLIYINAVLALTLILLSNHNLKAQNMEKNKVNVAAASEIYIDAPIEQVWEILAIDFGGIGKWASGVDRSTGSGEGINGATCSERACEISAVGFNDTKERILILDNDQHILRYTLFHGLPGFVKNAENEWQLKEQNGRTYVTAKTEMHATGLMGWMMRGFMRNSTKKVLNNMAEELKHYVETGNPHPRKVKAIAKFEKKETKKQAKKITT